MPNGNIYEVNWKTNFLKEIEKEIEASKRKTILNKIEEYKHRLPNMDLQEFVDLIYNNDFEITIGELVSLMTGKKS